MKLWCFFLFVCVGMVVFVVLFVVFDLFGSIVLIWIGVVDMVGYVMLIVVVVFFGYVVFFIGFDWVV